MTQEREKGFSLVEIMVAVGMLAAISVGVMQLMHNQQKALSHAEVKTSEIEMVNHVRMILADQDACRETFESYALGDQIPAIKNSIGNDAFQSGETYANGGLRINTIEILDDGVPTDGSLGMAKLRLSLERLKANTGVKQLHRDLTMLVKLDTDTGTVADCYTDEEGLVLTAKIEMCESLDGVYDPDTDKCSLERGGILGVEIDSSFFSPPTCTGRPLRVGISHMSWSGMLYGFHHVPPEQRAEKGVHTAAHLAIRDNKFVMLIIFENSATCHHEYRETYFNGQEWSDCYLIHRDSSGCGP